MTPNQLIDALKRLPAEVMDRPIMDGDETIQPGWALAPAIINVEPQVFYVNGDIGVIPDPDADPEEDLKNAVEGWGYPMRRELRATLESITKD